MKKTVSIIFIVCAMLISVFTMTSCNKQLFDTTYSFDRAIIELPNGEIVEGEIDSWNDYEGDQLQIKINGTTYLVHSSKAVMIND